jgi:hypothetical protein
MENEATIELTLYRKYNHGNFNNSDYTIKISGTEEQLKEQLEQKKEQLTSYLISLKNIVNTANDAKVEVKIAEASENK